jgi:hypothetical protein
MNMAVVSNSANIRCSFFDIFPPSLLICFALSPLILRA